MVCETEIEYYKFLIGISKSSIISYVNVMITLMHYCIVLTKKRGGKKVYFDAYYQKIVLLSKDANVMMNHIKFHFPNKEFAWLECVTWLGKIIE